MTQNIADDKPTHRSRLTNGSSAVAGVDGRTRWPRRFRDLVDLHLEDLGGSDATSEAERSLVRRAAALTVELERMEQAFALAGEADAQALDLYTRTAGTLKRLLESVGLQRRQRDVTPDPLAYARSRAAEAAE